MRATPTWSGLPESTCLFKFVIFPVEGPVTALSTAQVRGTPDEKLTTSRGIDLRIVPGNTTWSAAIIDCLRERNMAQGRIGVTCLSNTPRQPEGEIAYTTYDRVLKAFPQAKFAATGELLWPLKLAHSAEEIRALELATQVSEVGLQAMFESAHAGAIQREVWMRMFVAMLQASGERPWRLSIRAGAGGNSALNRPLEEVMPAGQILTQECTGSVLGYGSQSNHSVMLGAPPPDGWVDLAQYCIDTFHMVVEAIAPGKTLKEICGVYDQRLVAKGEKPGGLMIHSGGLGDLPRTGSRGEGAGVVVQTGMVFDVKPEFEMKGHGVVQIGDSVVVTDKGARRLGRRELKVISLS